jgi:phosphatidylglycerophosphatase A
MSDSSDSFQAGKSDRISARVAFLAPSGRSQVFFGPPQEIEGLGAFAVVGDATPDAPVGFELVITKSHRSYKSLGSVVEGLWRQLPVPTGIQEFGMRFCERTGISAVVGSRICGIAVPGVREYYFQRQGRVRGGRSWRGRLSALSGHCIMSVGGTGSLPVIGATAASAWVCVFAWVLQGLVDVGPWYMGLAALCLLSTVLCFLLEGWARKHYFAEDPREVVLDEVAGMSLALLIAGPGLGIIVAAFFTFRFFDIFKFGIHWIEKRRIHGTIVWDDLLAGIYAGLLVQCAFQLPAIFFYE